MVLPATGTAISMGRTGRAYYGPNGSSPTVQTSIGNTGTRKLNSQISRSPTISTAFSAVFGGRATPFTY